MQSEELFAHLRELLVDLPVDKPLSTATPGSPRRAKGRRQDKLLEYRTTSWARSKQGIERLTIRDLRDGVGIRLVGVLEMLHKAFEGVAENKGLVPADSLEYCLNVVVFTTAAALMEFHFPGYINSATNARNHSTVLHMLVQKGSPFEVLLLLLLGALPSVANNEEGIPAHTAQSRLGTATERGAVLKLLAVFRAAAGNYNVKPYELQAEGETGGAETHGGTPDATPTLNNQNRGTALGSSVSWPGPSSSGRPPMLSIDAPTIAITGGEVLNDSIIVQQPTTNDSVVDAQYSFSFDTPASSTAEPFTPDRALPSSTGRRGSWALLPSNQGPSAAYYPTQASVLAVPLGGGQPTDGRKEESGESNAEQARVSFLNSRAAVRRLSTGSHVAPPSRDDDNDSLPYGSARGDRLSARGERSLFSVGGSELLVVDSDADEGDGDDTVAFKTLVHGCEDWTDAHWREALRYLLPSCQLFKSAGLPQSHTFVGNFVVDKLVGTLRHARSLYPAGSPIAAKLRVFESLLRSVKVPDTGEHADMSGAQLWTQDSDGWTPFHWSFMLYLRRIDGVKAHHSFVCNGMRRHWRGRLFSAFYRFVTTIRCLKHEERVANALLSAAHDASDLRQVLCLPFDSLTLDPVVLTDTWELLPCRSSTAEAGDPRGRFIVDLQPQTPFHARGHFFYSGRLLRQVVGTTVRVIKTVPQDSIFPNSFVAHRLAESRAVVERVYSTEWVSIRVASRDYKRNVVVIRSTCLEFSPTLPVDAGSSNLGIYMMQGRQLAQVTLSLEVVKTKRGSNVCEVNMTTPSGSVSLHGKLVALKDDRKQQFFAEEDENGFAPNNVVVVQLWRRPKDTTDIVIGGKKIVADGDKPVITMTRAVACERRTIGHELVSSGLQNVVAEEIFKMVPMHCLRLRDADGHTPITLAMVKADVPLRVVLERLPAEHRVEIANDLLKTLSAPHIRRVSLLYELLLKHGVEGVQEVVEYIVAHSSVYAAVPQSLHTISVMVSACSVGDLSSVMLLLPYFPISMVSISSEETRRIQTVNPNFDLLSNATCCFRSSPLSMAASHGHLHVVKELVKVGVDALEYNGRALWHALRGLNPAVATYLVQNYDFSSAACLSTAPLEGGLRIPQTAPPKWEVDFFFDNKLFTHYGNELLAHADVWCRLSPERLSKAARPDDRYPADGSPEFYLLAKLMDTPDINHELLVSNWFQFPINNFPAEAHASGEVFLRMCHLLSHTQHTSSRQTFKSTCMLYFGHVAVEPVSRKLLKYPFHFLMEGTLTRSIPVSNYWHEKMANGVPRAEQQLRDMTYKLLECTVGDIHVNMAKKRYKVASEVQKFRGHVGKMQLLPSDTFNGLLIDNRVDRYAAVSPSVTTTIDSLGYYHSPQRLAASKKENDSMANSSLGAMEPRSLSLSAQREQPAFRMGDTTPVGALHNNGGWIFFDKDENVLQVAALVPARLIGAGRRERHLEGPYELDATDRHHILYDEDRWWKVTDASMRESGARWYCYLTSEDGFPFCEFGGVAYMFSDNDELDYRHDPLAHYAYFASTAFRRHQDGLQTGKYFVDLAVRSGRYVNETTNTIRLRTAEVGEFTKFVRASARKAPAHRLRNYVFDIPASVSGLGEVVEQSEYCALSYVGCASCAPLQLATRLCFPALLEVMLEGLRAEEERTTTASCDVEIGRRTALWDPQGSIRRTLIESINLVNEPPDDHDYIPVSNGSTIIKNRRGADACFRDLPAQLYDVVVPAGQTVAFSRVDPTSRFAKLIVNNHAFHIGYVSIPCLIGSTRHPLSAYVDGAFSFVFCRLVEVEAEEFEYAKARWLQKLSKNFILFFDHLKRVVAIRGILSGMDVDLRLRTKDAEELPHYLAYAGPFLLATEQDANKDNLFPTKYDTMTYIPPYTDRNPTVYTESPLPHGGFCFQLENGEVIYYALRRTPPLFPMEVEFYPRRMATVRSLVSHMVSIPHYRPRCPLAAILQHGLWQVAKDLILPMKGEMAVCIANLPRDPLNKVLLVFPVSILSCNSQRRLVQDTGLTLLHWACLYGDHEVTRSLLGDMSKLKRLMWKDDTDGRRITTTLYQTSQLGFDPLHCAVYSNSIECARQFLEFNCPDARIHTGTFAQVKIHKKKAASVDAKLAPTAIALAVVYRYYDMTKLLLEEFGSNPVLRVSFPYTAPIDAHDIAIANYFEVKLKKHEGIGFYEPQTEEDRNELRILQTLQSHDRVQRVLQETGLRAVVLRILAVLFMIAVLIMYGNLMFMAGGQALTYGDLFWPLSSVSDSLFVGDGGVAHVDSPDAVVDFLSGPLAQVLSGASEAAVYTLGATLVGKISVVNGTCLGATPPSVVNECFGEVPTTFARPSYQQSKIKPPITHPSTPQTTQGSIVSDSTDRRYRMRDVEWVNTTPEARATTLSSNFLTSWIDESVRAVVILGTLYMPQRDQVATIRILVEITSNTVVVPQYQMIPTRTHFFTNDGDTLQLFTISVIIFYAAFYGVTVSMMTPALLYHLAQALRYMYRIQIFSGFEASWERKARSLERAYGYIWTRITRTWLFILLKRVRISSTVDFTLFTFLVLVVVYHYDIASQADKLPPVEEMLRSPHTYYDLQTLADTMTLHRIFLAILLGTSVMGSLVALHLAPHVGPVISAILHTLFLSLEVWIFLMLLLAFVFLMSITAYWLYHPYLSSFRTFPQAMLTVFYTFVEEPNDTDEMFRLYSAASPVYFAASTLTVKVIFLNILVAVLTDVYGKRKTESTLHSWRMKVTDIHREHVLHIHNVAAEEGATLQDATPQRIHRLPQVSMSSERFERINVKEGLL